MVSGKSVSRTKLRICCSLPSSKILKSVFSRFPTSAPFLVRTLAKIFTRLTSILMVVSGSSLMATSGTGAEDDFLDWAAKELIMTTISSETTTKCFIRIM